MLDPRKVIYQLIVEELAQRGVCLEAIKRSPLEASLIFYYEQDVKEMEEVLDWFREAEKDASSTADSR